MSPPPRPALVVTLIVPLIDSGEAASKCARAVDGCSPVQTTFTSCTVPVLVVTVCVHPSRRSCWKPSFSSFSFVTHDCCVCVCGAPFCRPFIIASTCARRSGGRLLRSTDGMPLDDDVVVVSHKPVL